MRLKAPCLVTVLALLGGACSDSGGLDPAADSRSDASSGVFFAEHDITFVFPDGWQESYDEDLQEPAWRLCVSPTPFSGNWMSFLYLPGASRRAFNATEELFDSYVAELEERSQRIVRGPAEIELADLAGRELSVEGIVGERTGQALMGEVVLLYGEDVTYVLLAQYEPESRDEILSAWKTMLANLELPARAGVDAGVLLIANFDNGPEPFEDASGTTFRARAVDGR